MKELLELNSTTPTAAYGTLSEDASLINEVPAELNSLTTTFVQEETGCF